MMFRRWNTLHSVIKSKCLRNGGANEDVRAEGIRIQGEGEGRNERMREGRVAFTVG